MDLGGDGVPRPLFECGTNRSGLTFTRDGSRAVFVAGDQAQLWVVDLATGERTSPASGLADRARWFQVLDECDRIALFAAPPAEPAASGGAAPAADAKKGRVLWFVPLTDGGAPKATQLAEGDGVRVSADGRFASIARVESDVKRQLVVPDFLTDTVTTFPVRADVAGDPAAKQSLTLHDFTTGQSFTPPLDEGSRFMLLDAEWSPTGARLLVHRLSGDFHSRQLLVVDPERRRAWPLFSERDDAWIGGPTLLAAWRRDGAEVLFTSEQSGWCHLYSVAAEGGEPRALTSGEFEVRHVRPLEDGRRALVLSNEKDRAERTLSVVDLASGERHDVASPRGCVGDFVASRDGGRVAYLHEELGVPSDVWSAPVAAADGVNGTGAVQLSDCVPDALRELALPPPQIVDLEDPVDHQGLRALLYRPEGLAEGSAPPAVLFVHGAGYLQNVTRSTTEYGVNYLFHERLAKLGFVVLDVDYRHSAGYGRKFRTDVYGFMGGRDLDDEVAGADYLKSIGCDPARIGIYGGSYGGFMTLMALFTKPDVFACGAALRSVSDWRSYNAWYTNARLGDPKKDAENYRRSSPIDHVEGLKKPLLLLHGLKDSNVFAQDTIKLVEKLIHLGKSFDLMLYPSQDHTFSDPDSWVDEYGRIERLFVRELQPRRPNPTTRAPRDHGKASATKATSGPF
jgi:dipeptidyl aminopeptidase/acylaminoacyl peptidase